MPFLPSNQHHQSPEGNRARQKVKALLVGPGVPTILHAMKITKNKNENMKIISCFDAVGLVRNSI